MKIVITYGTYDLLHIGHMNLLLRAKALGDYLIVGVTSEDYDRSRGKLHVSQSTKKRVKAIQKLDFVDEVIVEKHKNQKPINILDKKVDIFAIGDDWVGKFDYLKEFCHVEYLARTEGVSSTLLRASSLKNIKLGVIGTGRIAKRFVDETAYVKNVEIHSVLSRKIDSATNFIMNYDIHYGFDDIEKFLDSSIDAVYIASPHEYHFEQAKIALTAGKHVLCEKPISLKKGELKILMKIARKKKLVLLEAIKTAFMPAFNKILDLLDTGVIGEVNEVRGTFTKLIEDKNSREWNLDNGGAINELATYPLLLAQKILGISENHNIVSILEDGVDSHSVITSTHKNNKISISTVAIGSKSEGCAIISGKKGYIYIPAPWWLTKDFFIRFEDPSLEQAYHFDFDGDGIRYEISEFITMIQRKKYRSKRLSHSDMLGINRIIVSANQSE